MASWLHGLEACEEAEMSWQEPGAEGKLLTSWHLGSKEGGTGYHRVPKATPADTAPSTRCTLLSFHRLPVTLEWVHI